MLLSLKEESVSESTRYAVLGLVARRPTYGYALVEQLGHGPLEESLVPTHRSIYKMLRALKEEQLIELLDSEHDREPDGPSRRRYGVTPEGERRLEAWLRSRPETFTDLRLRVAAARQQDLPLLIDVVRDAEHACLARLQELRAPDVASLSHRGGSWEAVSAALLSSIEVSEVAGRSKLLRDLRRELEALCAATPAPGPDDER
jgi:DNA-binding PadR family transcriptional regulator